MIAQGSHLGLQMMFRRDFSEFLSVKSFSSDDVRDDNFKWNVPLHPHDKHVILHFAEVSLQSKNTF